MINKKIDEEKGKNSEQNSIFESSTEKEKKKNKNCKIVK